MKKKVDMEGVVLLAAQLSLLNQMTMAGGSPKIASNHGKKLLGIKNQSLFFRFGLSSL